MKKHIIKLNEYSFGTILGIGMSFVVIVTNIIFPSNKTDDGMIIMFCYLFLFVLFAIGGYISSRKTKTLKKGAVGGAVTALISISMVMLTFFIIDNLFLDIISRQPDKIWAFSHQTEYTNMRDFINHGLLRGLIFALPVITVIAAGFGIVGAVIARRLRPQ